ncbi:MAG: IS200/IS605 family transposase [Bacteroidetes bacterium]|nr:IS200/IS605 family transposase [Bacteroidota bacterium]
MSHSLSCVIIHVVWGTKFRKNLIEPLIEKDLHAFLYEEFKKLKCPAIIINGIPDHVHCLFRLDRNQSVGAVMRQVKGSSAFYLNQHPLMEEKFQWQEGYAAFSVSQRNAIHVYNYIKVQKEHHRIQNFDEEFEELNSSLNPDFSEDTE